MMYM